MKLMKRVDIEAKSKGRKEGSKGADSRKEGKPDQKIDRSQ